MPSSYGWHGHLARALMFGYLMAGTGILPVQHRLEACATCPEMNSIAANSHFSPIWMRHSNACGVTRI